MLKIFILPWALAAIWILCWTFRWTDHSTASDGGYSILNEVDWYTNGGDLCAYVYSLGELDDNTMKANVKGPWQAVIEYRWPVWSGVFPNKQAAVNYVEGTCRGSGY